MSRSAVVRGRRIRAAAVVAAGAAVLCLHTSAQTPAPQDPPPQRQVFRAGANFVVVDAYPTRDGRVVDDLTIEDFKVYEDGKLQRVEQFEFVRGVPDGPDAVPQPTRLEAAERLVADPRRRVFVVFLTGYRVSPEGAANTRAAMAAFFGQSVAPSDLFGILRPLEPATNLVLGEQPEQLIDTAMTYWDWASLPHPPGFPRMPAEQDVYNCLFAHQSAGGVEALMDVWRVDKVLTTLDELTVRLAAMREARSNILMFSGAMGLSSIRPMMGAAPPGLGPGGRAVTAPLSACDFEYERLAGARLADRFQNIIDTAERAGVSISVIDPAGLSAYDQDMSATRGRTLGSMTARWDTLRTLASATGGTSIVGAAEIGPALIKLAAGQSGHYELGYYSSNNKFDGKFRSISVKVNRPSVSVVARKGYQAPTAAMLEASEDAAARAGTEPPPPAPAEVAIAELGRVDPEADVYTYAARRGDRLAVVAEIASGEVELGHWSDGAAVDVALSEGGAAGATGHADIPRGARSALILLPWKPSTSRQSVGVRITAERGELADRIDVPAGATSLLGDALVFRASTLPNAPLHAVADFAFRRTERIHVEWPVLAALDRRLARLLDPHGRPLTVNASAMETTDAGAITLAADVVLNPLAPGEYVLEVVAGGGAKTETRLVAFRLVR